jgi:hypothetical protein
VERYGNGTHRIDHKIPSPDFTGINLNLAAANRTNIDHSAVNELLLPNQTISNEVINLGLDRTQRFPAENLLSAGTINI